MYNDVYYMSQYLRDIGFNEDEQNEFFEIIKSAVDQSKDIESQITYTGNNKYINAYSLLSNSFTSDWDYYSKLGD